MLSFLKKGKENNRLANKNSDNNIILTNDVQLSLNTAKTGKNLNVCVIGGAGTGKTYNYVLPNILQANTSYVITDRDGYMLKKTGKFLEKQGYKIKVLNLIDTKIDDMELGLIGDRKTAVFIPISGSTANNNVSDIITRIFYALYNKAETFPDNRLPVHVRFMFDDLPNIAYISDLEKHSAVCGSKNISVNIILQDIVQLKIIYNYWDIILNNCDSILFLGSRSVETLKCFSDLTGINADKLFALHADECVLNIRGLPPVYGKKFNPEKHINYDRIENSVSR